ncbi:hypothetical protein [Pedobacter soli]|uniref:Uncharacterized protein n=1 Tax=Pedobacter soli TaxID=390242 RepID=A0A1G6XQQ6_9SPHI|nr:hypothetical protein [Pedobacter soli]SDD80508.1 hypothetical protein SAMN04488024_1081 [Pedobacter soli]
MNFKTNAYFFFLIVFTLCFGSCKKEILPSPDSKGFVYFKNVKSLKLIKEVVQHNWKIHYGYGGLTGKTRFDMPNSSFRFLSENTIQFVNNGIENSPSKITWERKETVFSSEKQWQMVMANGPAWIPESIHNDTLIMVPNTVEPIGYSMTKN